MKFGLHLDSSAHTDASALLESWSTWVRIADAGGFDYLSVVDHLVPFPGFKPLDRALFEPWQVLSAFAMITEHLTLLTLVSNAPLSHPARLAKQASTLDHISKGRMMLGLGAGGYPADESALGISNRSQTERYQRLAECIAVTKRLWNEAQVSHRGKWYDLSQQTSSPRPVGAAKILVAGKSDAILNIAAATAAAVNFAFTPSSELPTLMQRLKSALDFHNRPINELDVTLLDRIFLGDTDQQAQVVWDNAGAPAVNHHAGLIGGPERIIQQIKLLEASGVDTLFLMFNSIDELRPVCGRRDTALLTAKKLLLQSDRDSTIELETTDQH